MRIPASITVLLAGALLTGCSRPATDSARAAPAAASPAAPASKPVPDLEFVGVKVEAEETFVAILDHRNEQSQWVGVGRDNGIVEVLRYDQSAEQVTVRADGHTIFLTLRPARPEVVIPPAPQEPLPALPGEMLTQAMAAIPLPSGPGPDEAPAAPASPLSDEDREVAEREARMLVSDLLEISQIQRKAYEEKKAAEMAASGNVQ